MQQPINERDPFIQQMIGVMRENRVPGPYVINGITKEIAPGIFYGYVPKSGQIVGDS